MEIGTLFLLALFLVCPLTMFWLMRYGHRTPHDGTCPPSPTPPTPEERGSEGQESRDTSGPGFGG